MKVTPASNSLTAINTTLSLWAEEQANEVIQSWNEDIHRPVYLWYKPSNRAEWGAFRACMDPPGPDWKLAVTNRVRYYHEFGYIRTMIRDLLRTLPVLPTA